MDKQLTPAEVGQILGYKDHATIRRVMRKMIHMENPLRVTEKALMAWINERTFRPGGAEGQPAQAPTRIPRRKGGTA